MLSWANLKSSQLKAVHKFLSIVKSFSTNKPKCDQSNVPCHKVLRPTDLTTPSWWLKMSWPFHQEPPCWLLNHWNITMMTSLIGNIFRVTGHCAGNSPVPGEHKGRWHGALMFSLICVWINGWINNRGAGDLRRHRTHYDVIVMHRCTCITLRRTIHILDYSH